MKNLYAFQIEKTFSNSVVDDIPILDGFEDMFLSPSLEIVTIRRPSGIKKHEIGPFLSSLDAIGDLKKLKNLRIVFNSETLTAQMGMTIPMVEQLQTKIKKGIVSMLTQTTINAKRKENFTLQSRVLKKYVSKIFFKFY